MVWNRGVTFGLMQAFGDWGHVGLALLSLAVVAGLLVWLSRVQTVWTAVAIGAIAGGAVGNIVDRLRFGAVVDFIHVVLNSPWGELFPWVFNVGDSAIVCGVGALLLEQYVWPAKPRND